MGAVLQTKRLCGRDNELNTWACPSRENRDSAGTIARRGEMREKTRTSLPAAELHRILMLPTSGRT